MTESILYAQACGRVDVPDQGILCQIAPHTDLGIPAVRQGVALNLGIS